MRCTAAVGAVVLSACWGPATVVELPEVRTPLAWTNECPDANPLGGVSLREPELEDCFAIAERASPAGEIQCWITFDKTGDVIGVRCPRVTDTQARACLEVRLLDTVVVPYTDCAGNAVQYTTDLGIFWSGEASTVTSLPRLSRIESAVE